ncbi:hypothetical protein A2Z33_06120 [Candidatus Gottesmanbacteria bacterium RBG_16_52_11]|uniref:Uncharacterized protein n=1 Tax=Candidatus Gottesmanbacteria bacterium RBG_16_52_11 TaxID=1798374 RepID=A0A1F5YY80_9BACT|nr:MAG: hypothetical protein A2Z33_06120 [Candidatus Gottesmanbacteria bacterium RBG_16_52_11]
MMQNNNITKKNFKQRLTAFVNPILVKRAKVRGTLEGLTLSEVVEKALEAYVPEIESVSDRHIQIKFATAHTSNTLVTGIGAKAKRNVAKHTKALVVPR